jgi:hypothetical protein
MKEQHDFLATSAARLAALIADQERLLEIIRHKQTELVGMDTSVPTTPSSLPRPT